MSTPPKPPGPVAVLFRELAEDPERLAALVADLQAEPGRAVEVLEAREREDAELVESVLAELEHGARRGTP